MKNTLKLLIATFAFVATGSLTMTAQADMTKTEKATSEMEGAKNDVKEKYRDAKNKGCEMINGKMECAPQKVKNEGLKIKDKAAKAAHDVEKKVD